MDMSKKRWGALRKAGWMIAMLGAAAAAAKAWKMAKEKERESGGGQG